MTELVVVDDDELTLEAASRQFSEDSDRLRCFADERVAMDYLKGHEPRVVILDQRMPCVNGIDVLRELRRCGALASAKVYLASGVDPDANMLSAARSLDASWLPKDIFRDRGALHRLLDS